ncbi:acetyltransferase [Streptomyces sp. NBC_01320]|uniref:acetyltransferase n=1 Tax=Streptomyces sp. NBC_01320 TaxID=2903824 RepID=UPI002E10FBAD|nr:acetyltransferase [Streptomyces sp. NBC_01320]
MRKSRAIALTAAAGALAVVGTAAPAYAATSPASICDSGYSVIDSKSLSSSPAATTYLLWNGSTNCVVTIRGTAGGATLMHAKVKVEGGSWKVDEGDYTSYAGPVRVAAAGKCVMWGGGINEASYTSGWEHCG